MPDQYFTRKPRARHRRARGTIRVRGIAFDVDTDASVFSREGLDRGTQLLIEALELGRGESLLDLGCGYGPIGIAAAKLEPTLAVVMTDVNERAVDLARRNVAANGVRADVRLGDLYEPVRGLSFDHVACNPPIRAGKTVVLGIVRGAREHLEDGGRLWIVARTRQGAGSIRDAMRETFRNAEIVRRGSGYKVLRSERRTD